MNHTKKYYWINKFIHRHTPIFILKTIQWSQVYYLEKNRSLIVDQVPMTRSSVFKAREFLKKLEGEEDIGVHYNAQFGA